MYVGVEHDNNGDTYMYDSTRPSQLTAALGLKVCAALEGGKASAAQHRTKWLRLFCTDLVGAPLRDARPAEEVPAGCRCCVPPRLQAEGAAHGRVSLFAAALLPARNDLLISCQPQRPQGQSTPMRFSRPIVLQIINYFTLKCPWLPL